MRQPLSREIITTIDLLRHGEPEGGVKYRGALDDPLSETGWMQLRAAVGRHRPWEVIVSSPLRRCAAFAEELSANLGIELEIEPRLREIGFGEWEGRTPAEVMADSQQELSRFWRDPEQNTPPGGESLRDCAARIGAGWRALLERHGGRHVLVVGHGGMIRLVLCRVLEIPLRCLWRLEVPYATFSRIRVYSHGPESEPFLVFHGKGLG